MEWLIYVYSLHDTIVEHIHREVYFTNSLVAYLRTVTVWVSMAPSDQSICVERGKVMASTTESRQMATDGHYSHYSLQTAQSSNLPANIDCDSAKSFYQDTFTKIGPQLWLILILTRHNGSIIVRSIEPALV